MLKDYLRAFNDLYGDAEAYLSDEDFRVWRDHALRRMAESIFLADSVREPTVLTRRNIERRPW